MYFHFTTHRPESLHAKNLKTKVKARHRCEIACSESAREAAKSEFSQEIARNSTWQNDSLFRNQDRDALFGPNGWNLEVRRVCR
jgi:hypothetical protein